MKNKINPNRTLNPLESIECTIAFSSRDMSSDKRDAWLYGIILGWDDESLEEFQEKFNWTDLTIKRLRILHENYKSMASVSEEKFQEEIEDE